MSDMGEIIWGNELAKQYRATFKTEVDELRSQKKRIPGLCVILVGDNPASVSYVSNKQKACHEVGIKGEVINYPDTISEDILSKKIIELNNDDNVDGILIQLPLPKHINESRLLGLIDVKKDVDGLHPLNIARLQLKQNCLVPCTPMGVMEILKSIKYDLEGKYVVIVGRSNLVGRPIAQLRLHANATVTICHSKTKDLKAFCQRADVLVAAVGKIALIKADYVKPGAVVIDVGVSRGEDGKLHGDVDFDAVKPIASYITPVPKGVGPMTIAMLMKNTLLAYHMRES